MTIRQLLAQATERLKAAGCESARLDAELLLMFAGNLSRIDLITRAHDELPVTIEQAYEKLLAQRETRLPLAYITGEKEFWSRPFRVTPDVLIPRPETEHLIEAVLEAFPDSDGRYLFCDIGSGSGCIAVTLACEYPQAHIIATDISEAALSVARSNAENLNVSERITFRAGDMLNAFTPDDGPFDAIISNPPYVAEFEMQGLEAELDHEPRGALTDGSDGLQFLATILNEGCERLIPHGYIIVETGTCGLPQTPSKLEMRKEIFDLAGHLRGGIYQAR